MIRWILRRLGAALLVMWGAATATFLAVQAVPGDVVDALLGPGTVATPELRAQVAADIGVDRPLAEQYLVRMGHLLIGDLGYSYRLGEPVSEVLAGQVAPTIELAVAALLLALTLAVLGAVLTAGRGRIAKAVATTIELVAVSVPAFWLGIVLLSVFSFRLRLFPVAGGSGVEGLVLPAVALAVPIAGVLAQVIRQELATADGRPFVLTARSRGLGETTVLLRHTLRHALLPVTTMSGFILGSLMSGAVLVENIFARPGLGRVLVDAVAARDLPVVTVLVLLSAVVFVAADTVVNVLHPIIDPRLGRGMAS
ncbi:ABC transporter permease [Thermostaphylospora chromogena]|uniref:Peptide/nickel transport system permease protein n=1 Tax=Thermostaphylospora chromogena TaxID=35622 RepID=A0A1H1I7J3_9ACTN|nr:ABC transporter permease [Thermostaphylospora chromogena]SDR33632.1 peptide/nickel transport system permease protein [Thermostaphylospora chromogena]